MKVVAKKAKIPDPLSEIAANLLASLETHRSAPSHAMDSPFLTWSQLVASQSGVSMDWATASLQKSPAKGQIVIAVTEDLKSPVALSKDVERLAQDAVVLQRLVQHPFTGCSETVPLRSLSELCKGLDKNLRKPVEAWWSQSSANLPAGLSRIEQKSGKKIVVAIHDERFVRPDVTLSRKLTAALESLRKLGDTSYPALLSDLLTRADVAPDDPLLVGAFLQPPFADSTMLVAGKLPHGWLALSSDAEQVVNSEGFLRRLLLQNCDEATPEVKLSTLAKIMVKELQPRFSEVWRTHFELQRKFPFVEFSAGGSKAKPDLILRDARFPRAEKVLSEQLVKHLDAQKIIGESAYPTPWSRLLELTKTQAGKATVQKAMALEPFVGRVLLAFPASSDSPAAFIDDAAELAASTRLLELIVSQLVTDDQQCVQADKLALVKGLHPLLKPHVAVAVERLTSTKQMPPGFGALRIGSKWQIFRLQDLTAGPAVAPSSDEQKSRAKKSAPTATAKIAEPKLPASMENKPPATSAIESKAVNSEPLPEKASEPSPQVATPAESLEGFRQDLEAAFQSLSEVSRLPGCVSLADLRPVLNRYPRETFDAELIRLRKAGQYSLSVVEGRYPLSDAERDSCLIIDNSPHLLVRRRES